MKTAAIVFEAPEKVSCREVELPEPGEGDVLIATEVSAVSVGTERWAYLGRREELSFPNVPGYMAVGRVVKAGKQASLHGWKEGDRAYYFASRFSGELEGRSWMGSHCAMAVVDVCREQNPHELDVHHLEKMPDGLAAEDGAFAGLCAVAMRGIEMAGVPAGANVLVCGLGMIGQYAVQVCRLKGAKVSATDIVASRLETAGRLGASAVLDGKAADLHEQLKKLAPDGFDLIIDTSSAVSVVNSLFAHLRLRGKFIFQAWYAPPSPLDLNALHQRLPTCYFPCAHSGTAVAAALSWAERGWLETRPLITHTVTPDGAAEAYAMMARGSDEFIGILIDWRKGK